MRQKLIELVKTSLKNLGVQQNIDIEIYIGQNKDHGDYSTNVALQLSKLDTKFFNQLPLEIAKQIRENLEHNQLFEKVEIAGPGFINFFIKTEVLARSLGEIDEQFIQPAQKTGKKISIEYVSANPTGPLHFGNARGGPIGDVLANVLEYMGNQVISEYLNNNIGGQIFQLGKSIKAKIQGVSSKELQYQGSFIDHLAKQFAGKVFLSDQEIGRWRA